MLRVLMAAALFAAAGVAGAAPAQAAPGCAPGGNPSPLDFNTRQIGDVDGDGLPDMLWVGKSRGPNGAMTRTVGITTASGSTSQVQVASASPIPLRAFAVDVADAHLVIAGLGRSAPLYAFAQCRLHSAVDARRGRPFVFDLENLAGTGTGVGCDDFGDGRRLVALQALEAGGQWTVRRTEVDLNGIEVDLNGIEATYGRSDTLAATSAHDPAVTTAQTISCGDRNIDQDGVQEP